MNSFISNVIILLAIASTIVNAQSEVDFDLPDIEVCLQEKFSPLNQSNNSNQYVWDFCQGDFESAPQVTLYTNNKLFAGVENVKIYHGDPFDTVSYIFIGSSNGEMYRMKNNANFSEPAIFEPIIGGLISMNRPTDIDIIKIGGVFYGYIVDVNDSKLYEIIFGEDIGNTPTTIKDLGFFPSLNRPYGVQATVENDSLKLLISNFNAAHLTYLKRKIGSTVFESYNIPTGHTAASALDLINFGGRWIASISYNSPNIVKYIDFGEKLTSMPNSIFNFVSLGLSNPTGNQFVVENGQLLSIISARSSGLFKVGFGEEYNSNPTVVDYGSLELMNNSTRGISLIKNRDSEWVGLIVQTHNIVNKVLFPNDCPTNEGLSEINSPQISYSQPGTYPITLTAYDENGNSSSITKEITVTSNIAPTINFTATGKCITDAIQFTPTSDQTITSYTWDFGDAQTGTGRTIIHQYTTPSTYKVRLTVASENGCGNFIEQDITIYPEPVPSFTPVSENICTNKTYVFENTTPGDYGGNISYEWFVNDVSVSTEEDLTYEFATGGAKEVKLVASVPGCAVETVQHIANVYEGAEPAFTVTDNCIGTLFEFTNNSTGPTTSTHWDFGNGFTSSLESPSYQYATPGTYDVTLTLTNAAGCETQVTEPLTVFERPVVQFTNDLACAGIATAFADKTSVGDANISSWRWDFDDPDSELNASSEKNTNHIFSKSGSFNVQLVAESTNGCRDSIQQVVQILPSPVADFDYDKVCLDEMIRFEDTSQPVPEEDITSRAWDLNGEFSDEINPQTSFELPGEYQIGLTVSSENRCTSTVYKKISVLPVPEVSFGVEDACDNIAVHFFDTTEENITERSWDFPGLNGSTDSSAFHRFPGAGNYRVGLKVTTSKGCKYEGSQEVTINKAPTAAFEPSVFFGAPPLEVIFSNHSTGGSSYFWSFSEGSNAAIKDPTYVFTNKDTYDVQLVVTDQHGCEDTAVRQINILDPHLELELKQLFITESAAGKNLLLTLSNNGTLVIDSMQVKLELGNELITNETIIKTILPGEQMNQLLNISFTNRELEYVCVTVNAKIEGIGDDQATNNTKCIGFKDDVIILAPYPNPGADVFNLRVVTEAESTAFVRLYDLRGELVKDMQYPTLYAGINDVLIEVDDVKKGIYVLKVSCGNKEGIFRIVIE